MYEKTIFIQNQSLSTYITKTYNHIALDPTDTTAATHGQAQKGGTKERGEEEEREREQGRRKKIVVC